MDRLLAHWREGFGAGYNPHRGEALQLVHGRDHLEEALRSWSEALGEPARVLLTGAARRDGLSFAAARELLRETPLLLVLGTGWGLAPQLFTPDAAVLAPIAGGGSYNHLSVRAAAAIMLDRLLGVGED